MKEVAEEQQDFVKDITKMSDDFDRWYTDVVRKAELADWSGVRGMMVVRPYGWAMWEAIQRAFDDMIKESGHENWAFPLLIPREYLMKEAEHVEGFAPEVAWVTRAGSGNEELEEPLAVRPTSETIVGSLIKRYIQSHRDLPKLTNQWNSVVRWEMRSRLFLRSREFWWQEGHTFHADAKEAMDEVDLILGYYRDIAQEWLAVPVLAGKKSPAETFPGAVYTLTLEGLMRDGMALQMGTSHYFGQNFARAYDISFSNKDNERELCYSTSWGISTRLVGALVMAHGDDSGLIVPPMVAPIQVVIVPIFRDAGESGQGRGIHRRVDRRAESGGDPPPRRLARRAARRQVRALGDEGSAAAPQRGRSRRRRRTGGARRQAVPAAAARAGGGNRRPAQGRARLVPESVVRARPGLPAREHVRDVHARRGRGSFQGRRRDRLGAMVRRCRVRDAYQVRGGWGDSSHHRP